MMSWLHTYIKLVFEKSKEKMKTIKYRALFKYKVSEGMHRCLFSFLFNMFVLEQTVLRNQ